ncbi:hypothetical protein [Kribbella italica]|uniref:Uncharacterized protein n=1 Tax=Kribbella italica TaxID=1540520 RepID=A0A7W9MYY1_9ACTN|nr:hypothetical protein [Kribbella italica]MBB5841636.1 hypothetical protein [Kribbella italica]
MLEVQAAPMPRSTVCHMCRVGVDHAGHHECVVLEFDLLERHRKPWRRDPLEQAREDLLQFHSRKLLPKALMRVEPEGQHYLTIVQFGFMAAFAMSDVAVTGTDIVASSSIKQGRP